MRKNNSYVYKYNSFHTRLLYITKPLVSCFGLKCLDFEESSYNQLPGSLSTDYKYLHANEIPNQLNFTSQTILDYIRYIIGVLCYNVKSQMNILVHVSTLACFNSMRYRPGSGIYTFHTWCRITQA